LAYRKVVDALHEMGLLLLVFAPLDYAVDVRPLTETWRTLIGFIALGMLFLGASIVGEWRMYEHRFLRRARRGSGGRNDRTADR
jgi:hypothetical protein